jgi:hypothetical protein
MVWRVNNGAVGIVPAASFFLDIIISIDNLKVSNHNREDHRMIHFCFVFLKNELRLESGPGNRRGFVVNLTAPGAFCF